MAGPGDRTDAWTSLTTGTRAPSLADGAARRPHLGVAATTRRSSTARTAGTRWTPQVNPADDVMRDLFAVDGNVIWGTGWTGNVIRTVNGGATWTQVGKIAPMNAATCAAACAHSTTRPHGSATASAACSRRSMAERAGLSRTPAARLSSGAWTCTARRPSGRWSASRPDRHYRRRWRDLDGATKRTGEHLYRVDAYDSNNAIAAGALRAVIQTTDGGTTWTTIPTPTVPTRRRCAHVQPVPLDRRGDAAARSSRRRTPEGRGRLPRSAPANDLRACGLPTACRSGPSGEGGRAMRAPVSLDR